MLTFSITCCFFSPWPPSPAKRAFRNASHRRISVRRGSDAEAGPDAGRTPRPRGLGTAVWRSERRVLNRPLDPRDRRGVDRGHGGSMGDRPDRQVDGARPVGRVAGRARRLTRINLDGRTVLELGWVVRDARTGMGYATEIGWPALGWAAEQYPTCRSSLSPRSTTAPPARSWNGSACSQREPSTRRPRRVPRRPASRRPLRALPAPSTRRRFGPLKVTCFAGRPAREQSPPAPAFASTVSTNSAASCKHGRRLHPSPTQPRG